MKNTKGKFIVLEGIDGCGGETQTRKLVNYFKNNHIDYAKKNYPNYNTSFGRIIKNHLYSKKGFPENIQSLVYFIDIYQEKELIQELLNQGKFVISDRYFTATLAYQGREKDDLNRLLELEKLFNLNKPDLTILIKISPETSLKRKMKEKKGNLDNFERDLVFLKEVADNYDKLVNWNTYCDWKVVDGELSKEEVFNKIINIINNN